ncbi:MAG TPA: type II secretion system protein [Verrucomicrobiae bacterium]|nr:type II secretion system protein [Verrucomicrobiae bacterium]
MKMRFEQPKTSGVTLIEILAVVALFLIVSASVRIVSDSGARPKPPISESELTNALKREIHAPRNAFHPHEAPHQK